MAFDSDTRNKLARMIAQARQLVTDEFTQQLQEIYGIQPDGSIIDLAKLTHLDDEQASTAKLLRERIAYLVSGMETEKEPKIAAIDRTIREQAFTILNRFAALRMCEERGFVEECVRGGMQSKGFKVYETVAGAGLGDIYERYRAFLFCLFDEIAFDLGVLFDRFSLQGLLFPREQALAQILTIINNEDLSKLWSEDETIGWSYQYFNSKEEREAMRKASSAPRNSRELAVRNQFFTPRYVVEFLTDNTLGRIWYEMRKGETALKKECRYLVRRPKEVFLEPGEKVPAEPENETDLSQEELLKKPVHIEHRPKKDPRDLRVLDPACGSGHFLLYTFDLLERIYEEAWEDLESPELEITGRTLREEYATLEQLRRAVPKLIIEYNLHGIDIDPRAVQVAALALWLRAQKTWKNLGIKAAERPQVANSNVVSAEPMPGEEDMRSEFTASLKPRVLGQLVDVAFDKMKFAGEAGSLLKVEEEIKDAVAEARKQWMEGPKSEHQPLFPSMSDLRPKQEKLRFDFKGVTDERFWEQAEDGILDALKDYARHVENGHAIRRRLFAEDAASGFAFIDLCRKRYDVVLMNPPFGAASRKTKRWMRVAYPLWGENILIAFLCRGLNLISNLGLMGCIADRSWLQKYDYRKFRAWIIKQRCLSNAVDLGWEVLDTANVETAVSIFAKDNRKEIIFGNDSLRESSERLLFPFASLFVRAPEFFNVIPNDSYAYAIHPTVYSWFARSCKVNEELITFQGGINSGNAFQTNRYHCEVSPQDIGLNSRWVLFQAGSPYSPFYYPTIMVSLCEQGSFKTLLSHPNARVPGIEYYGRPGIAYGKRTDSMYSYAMPAGGAFSWEGQAGFVPNDSKVGLYQALGFTNSSTYITLSNLVAGQHKYAGYLNTICCDLSTLPALATESEQIVEDLLSLDIANELSLRFVSINSSEVFNLSCYSQDRARLEDTLTKSIRSQHRHLSRMVAEALGVGSIFGNPPNFDPVRVLFGSTYSESLVLHSAFSYMIGCAYGRWDIRFATGEKAVPELPDPFLPLPVCPPGQLQNEKGLPFTEDDVRSLIAVGQWHYPIDILWDGILVDDPGFTDGQPHRDDIVRRVREVLDLLWKEKAHEIEQKACEILGAKTLRDYFLKPSGFFQDHLKRYSKSRRKAPIYWPLSTATGSYTIWLYYHRLTDQTLYACVNDYVNPKLDNVSKDIARLQEEVSKRATAQKRQQLEKLIDFAQELKDFREELLRVAAMPYKPNLNDGVMITAAPFSKLFRHNQWRKDLATCWKKLEAGEHDWAHLAYTVWPDRVKAKCKIDLSIANAHDQENLYEGDIAKKKKRQKKAKG